MTQAPAAPVVLIVLDGWGSRTETAGNAITAARTPIMDSLQAAYPHTYIQAAGQDVGLPEGQMGNSEVGHLNLGAGRIVPQELVRISQAVADRSLERNAELVQVCQEVRRSGGKLHLLGLCSEGGVHAHLQHLYGLLALARAQGVPQTCIHAFTDGRDAQPTQGIEDIAAIQAQTERLGVGRLVTLSGRYYAMDRDRRWDRIRQAYEVLTQDEPNAHRSASATLQACYERGITDEFIPPTRLAPGAIEPGDGAIAFNFRPDRARQLVSALVDPDFDGFAREPIQPLSFATLTQYDPELPARVAFKPQTLDDLLGEAIARQGWRQFRAAETEKYPHVTYFFNGGAEPPLAGEDRELVASPAVATYDGAPAMSAQAVTDRANAAIASGRYAFAAINYANPDMVAHTGDMEATVAAVETVDRCLGQLLEGIGRVGGTAIVTADHGNAECLWDERGNPRTAHTSNPVPLIVVEGERAKVPGYGTALKLRSDGRLADVAPTILDILQLPQPSAMTGHSLLEAADYEVRSNRTPVRVT